MNALNVFPTVDDYKISPKPPTISGKFFTWAADLSTPLRHSRCRGRPCEGSGRGDLR